MAFESWCRYMLGASLFFVLFGVVAAVASNTCLFEFWTVRIDEAFFGGRVPTEALEMRGFLMGPLGGTIAGSYLLQAFVVAVPFRRRERWAWHAVLWGMLLWFVVDSSVSAWHGAYFNIVMINLMPLIVFGPALYATRHGLK